MITSQSEAEQGGLEQKHLKNTQERNMTLGRSLGWSFLEETRKVLVGKCV